MGSDGLSIDDVLRDAFLVDAHGGDDAEGARVDLGAPVADDADDDLPPAVVAPYLAAVPAAEMGDVPHDAVHGAAEELLVLVVHGHDDEELGAAGGGVVALAEGEAGALEVVGVAGGGGVAHVGELAVGLVGAFVEQLAGDGGVEDEVSVE